MRFLKTTCVICAQTRLMRYELATTHRRHVRAGGEPTATPGSADDGVEP